MQSDLDFIRKRIVNNQPMALARFGDGEYCILNGIKCNRPGRFQFDPDNDDNYIKDELYKSLTYKEPNYYIGLPLHNKICSWYESQGITHNIVDANLFVSSNYSYFINYITLAFTKRLVYFVGNERNQIDKLPIPVAKFFKVGRNAWQQSKHLHKEILASLKDSAIVLIAAGPFACVLAHRIWERAKTNLVLDIGSVFDPWGFGEYTRGYHKQLGKNILEK